MQNRLQVIFFCFLMIVANAAVAQCYTLYFTFRPNPANPFFLSQFKVADDTTEKMGFTQFYFNLEDPSKEGAFLNIINNDKINPVIKNSDFRQEVNNNQFSLKICPFEGGSDFNQNFSFQINTINDQFYYNQFDINFIYNSYLNNVCSYYFPCMYLQITPYHHMDQNNLYIYGFSSIFDLSSSYYKNREHLVVNLPLSNTLLTAEPITISF